MFCFLLQLCFFKLFRTFATDSKYLQDKYGKLGRDKSVE